jgi:hypothetical protein
MSREARSAGAIGSRAPHDAPAVRVSRNRSWRRAAAFHGALALAVVAGGCRDLGPGSELQTLADTAAWVNPAPVGPPVLLAAGDVARCRQAGDDTTAALLDTLAGTVLALGDQAYSRGSAAEYRDCYHPSWGRHRARTRPAPGNHEYGSTGAAPYFAYFGDAAGPSGRGYYSMDIGGWHVISLNSNVAMHAGSAQARWLQADLATHPSRCTLAFWHHPRFSSGTHGSDPDVAPLWQVLADAGADVVLAGHDHIYERFARMSADGAVDDVNGIRSFVVGTGGADLYPFRDVPVVGSEVRYNERFGVLRLTLRDDAYAWAFIPVGGGAPIDAGEEQCHD